MSTSTVAIHGYAMRAIRESRGRKLADLADAVGVDRSYLTKVETGARTRVSPTVYAAILRELLIDDHRALLASPPARGDHDGEPEPSLAQSIARQAVPA
jgi:transcriptional regulator with XRE-family HTH domain